MSTIYQKSFLVSITLGVVLLSFIGGTQRQNNQLSVVHFAPESCDTVLSPEASMINILQHPSASAMSHFRSDCFLITG